MRIPFCPSSQALKRSNWPNATLLNENCFTFRSVLSIRLPCKSQRLNFPVAFPANRTFSTFRISNIYPNSILFNCKLSVSEMSFEMVPSIVRYSELRVIRKFSIATFPSWRVILEGMIFQIVSLMTNGVSCKFISVRRVAGLSSSPGSSMKQVDADKSARKVWVLLFAHWTSVWMQLSLASEWTFI